MPNPLDRQPSPTPEAGSFASLGVEAASSHSALSSPTSAPTLAGLSFKDFPSIIKTREILEDDFIDYGIYSYDPDSPDNDNSIVDLATLTELHSEAEATWSYVEGLMTVTSKKSQRRIADTITAQRELAPTYALLTNYLAKLTIEALQRLRTIEPGNYTSVDSNLELKEDSKSFSDLAKFGNWRGSQAAMISGSTTDNANLASFRSVTLTGKNGKSGNNKATNSVSFTKINGEDGCQKSQNSVSFSKRNTEDGCYESLRCFTAITHPTRKVRDSALITQDDGEMSNCLSMVSGAKLPMVPNLFRRVPDQGDALENIIVVEDRSKDADDVWLDKAKKKLAKRKFDGVLIVGGEVVYHA